MEIINNNLANSKVLKFRTGHTLDLPGSLVYSRCGMVPHLTDDILKHLPLINDIWHIPLETLYQQPGAENMQTFGESFHKFSSKEGKLLILNPNDTYLEKPDIYKYNEEKSFSIWVPGGRRKITPEEYMKFLQIFGFDICIPPSDSVCADESKKRNRKSFERTMRFLDQCIQIKEANKLDTPLLGVIEGGDSIFEREKCAKEVASRNVDGFVLSGFDRLHNNKTELLKICIRHLTKDKVLFMLGLLTPDEIVWAVENGIDVFDSVIAYHCAEKGCALNFPYDRAGETVRRESTPLTEPKEQHSKDIDDRETKDETHEEKFIYRKDTSHWEINLHNTIYKDDIRPLVSYCRCYCCSNLTRAYVHHLLITKEMLAPVLLMMHNLTHWFGFFEEIRCSRKENRWDNLKDAVLKNSNT